MVLRNAFSNFFGLLLHPLLQILLFPFYLRHLGLEGLGLISFLAMLVALLGVFTKGAGSALIRDIANRAKEEGQRESLLSFIRTFERLYLTIGVGVGLVLIALSPILAGAVKTETLSREVISYCIVLIAVRVAFAFAHSVYQATFAGLEKQLRGNIVYGCCLIMAAASGAFAVYVTKSILAFFLVEAINAVLSALLVRHFAYGALPCSGRRDSGLQWFEVTKLVRVSVGLIWTNGLGLVISQLDRLLISKALPLANLSIYTFGAAGGQLLTMVCGSYLAAVYPRVCQVAQQEGRSQLAQMLTYNTRVVATIAAATGLPLCFFASEILQAWTRNDLVTAASAQVMVVYVTGSLFLAQASVLYQAQMALRITRFGVVYNSFALVWLPGLIWWLVAGYGIEGAAIGWLAYALLGWLFNLAVSAKLVLGKASIARCVTIPAVSYIAGTGVFFVVRKVADGVFLNSSPATLALAAIGSVATLLICYFINFGLSLPKTVIFSSQGYRSQGGP